jgi:hypothetical protein
VAVRDFQIDYNLDASTRGSEVVVLTAPFGAVLVPVAEPGEVVTAGAVVARTQVDKGYRIELERLASTNRIDAAILRELDLLPGDVKAPITGVFEADGEGLRIASRGIDVVTGLTGVQALRLGSIALTGVASVETVVGQRQVECAAVSVVLGVANAESDRVAELRCRLPRTVETAAGLRARLHVLGPLFAGATVVPNSAIGTDDGGYVVTILVDGVKETVPIDVGPSDGVVRVVMTSLPDGAEIVPPVGAG